MVGSEEEFGDGIVPYIEHLRELPFVQRVLLPNSSADSGVDAVVKTPSGMREVQFKWSKSHLNARLLEHLIRSMHGIKLPVILLAPQIGGESARRLRDAGVNYVDRAGNCFVRLGEQYIAQIEGRSPPHRAPKERTLRPASVRVLFTLLADDEALQQTVRQVAARSGGVSPQTVTDVRKRLVAEHLASAVGHRYRWNPKGRERALDLLVANYDVLGHKLLVGRFRTQTNSAEEVEADIAGSLGAKRWDWWWGGGAALSRVTGYYRGTKTIVYTDRFLGLSGLKGLIRDEEGNVTIARLPGAVAVPRRVDSDEARVVHPLLVYLDLMSEGEERALDAAAEVRRTLFEEEGK